VIRAYLQLEELASHQELQHALQTALRENGLGVLILDSARKIVYKTPGVWEKIATHLPVLDDEATLPKELARWVFGGSETPDAWSFSAEPTRLILRRNRQSENRVLLLVSEENSAATTERLARFNLTRRTANRTAKSPRSSASASRRRRRTSNTSSPSSASRIAPPLPWSCAAWACNLASGKSH
jgi:hypothetical protein